MLIFQFIIPEDYDAAYYSVLLKLQKTKIKYFFCGTNTVDRTELVLNLEYSFNPL